LGNELLADDAFGFLVAEELGRCFPALDVVFTTDSGFHLIDYLTGVDFLIVVDSIQTGNVSPGTLYVLRSKDIQSPAGPSPHYVGLLETLQLANQLLLNVPKDIIVLAVEVADCLTLGGQMHSAVRSAVGPVADLVGGIVQNRQPGAPDDLDGALTQAVASVAAQWGSGRIVAI
jgi:hydrogenase maturation protease